MARKAACNSLWWPLITEMFRHFKWKQLTYLSSMLSSKRIRKQKGPCQKIIGAYQLDQLSHPFPGNVPMKKTSRLTPRHPGRGPEPNGQSTHAIWSIHGQCQKMMKNISPPRRVSFTKYRVIYHWTMIFTKGGTWGQEVMEHVRLYCSP